jgi:hypothetical protein
VKNLPGWPSTREKATQDVAVLSVVLLLFNSYGSPNESRGPKGEPPAKVDSGDLSGVFLGKDGSVSAGQIPGADEEEAAAHELLGHVWAEIAGGQPSIVGGQANPGNLKEALIAEDRVRNTDPSRGLKIRHQDSDQLIRPSDLPKITSPGSQP